MEMKEEEEDEKVEDDLMAVSAETWTERPDNTRREQTFDQSRDGSGSASEAGLEDAVSDRSDWDGGEEEGAEFPRVEGSVFYPRSNGTSVIVSVQGSDKTVTAAAATTTAEANKEGDDNQSVTTTTPGNQTPPPTPPAAAKRPGKVIVTNVTINSLTVTIQEATVAEGFFKGY